MRPLLLLALLAASRLGAQGAVTRAPGSLEEEFRALLQATSDGTLPGDSVSVDRRTAPHRTFIDEKGELTRQDRSVIRARPVRPSAEPRPWTPHFVVDDVSVDTVGDVAVVTSRVSVRMVLNDEPVLKQWRRTEVFRRRGAAWQSIAGQETVVPGVIVPAAADTSRYGAYVGRYQLFPGYDYVITRTGDRLMFNSRVAGDRELMPESPNVFVERGLAYRIIFLPDSSGKVPRLRLREFPGVEYDAIRVP